MNTELTTSSLKYPTRLEQAKSLADIFEVVKDAVSSQLGLSRGGLMLGIAELGGQPNGWIGGFYPLASNIIVMNKGPMNRIKREQPHLYNSYCFHILLHEYIHTVGYTDEAMTRRKALEISARLFGKDHHVTRMAADISQYFPHITYVIPQEQPQDLDMELVKGFDRSCSSYIW